MDISKKDWKLYRECVPMWQTRYIEKLNREYIELLSSEGDASDHFWELEKRIRKGIPELVSKWTSQRPSLTSSFCAGRA